MNSDFGSWLGFFLQFIYNALFTITVPGIGIPIIYLWVILAIFSILFIFFRKHV